MQPPVRAEPPSPREAQLAQRLVSLGLLSNDQARALWQRRMQGDARPLEQVLLQDRLVAPEALQRAVQGLAPPVPEPRHETLDLDGSGRRGAGRFGSGGGSGDGRPPHAVTPTPAARDAASSSRRQLARPVRGDAGPGDPPDLTASVTSSLRLKPGGKVPLSAQLEVTCERLLGQGGMGTVHLVHDPALGRRAALKLVKGEGNETRARRFKREVVVTARLDHPGIPPVYLSGRTPTGQDYLLMRFVDGRSLEAILDQTHGRDGGRVLPGGAKPAPEPRDLLDALVKVCEAVAYAHSRGIVHRDLKPANIMIGAFGETLVMDWGLARDLAESSQEDQAVRVQLATLLEDTKGLTQDGALLGTPGYMSPEQARGHDVGAPADVYALGALLVEVLTGEPPVVGNTTLEVLARTGQGEVTLPRARRPDVAPELDAIAAKALAREADRRYEGAAELGADLKAYLEGRAVSVYRYGPAEQLRRLARRHPAALAALGVTFVLSLVTVGAVAQARSGAAAAERRAAVERARGEAEAARAAFAAGAEGDVDATIGLALASLQAAQRWRVLAPQDEDAARAQHGSALALGDLAERAEQWSLAIEAFRQAGGLGVDDAGAAAALTRVEGARNAEAERRRREVARLVAAARDGTLTRRAEGLQDAVFELARYADPATVAQLRAELDRVSAALEAVVRESYLEAAAADPARGERELEDLAVVVDSALQAGLSRELPPGVTDRLVEAERRLERRAARTRGGARVKALVVLGARQGERVPQGDLDLARLACEALGRIGDAGAVPSLARHLAAERDVLRAIVPASALLRLGGAEGQRLVMAARARFGRGSAFMYRVDEMLSWLDAGEGPALEGETAQAYFKRGEWFEARRDNESAVAAFTRAIELDATMAEAYSRRGNMRVDVDPRGSLADFDRAIDLSPREPRYHANRSNARTRLGDFQGGVRDLDRALELDPDNPGMLMNRALAKQQAGDLTGAMADFDRSIQVDPSSVHSWINRGSVRTETGDLEGASADFEKALGLEPREVLGWLGRAILRHKRRELDLAQADLDQAIALKPDDLRAWELRGMVRRDRGDLEGALSDLTRFIALDAKQPRVWKSRAEVRSRLADARGALADLDEALRLDPKYRAARSLRAELLAQLDPGRARAEADAALAGAGGGGQDAHALMVRGRARMAEGAFREAGQDFQKAVDLAPDDPAAWLGLACSVARGGDPRRALAAFDRSLELAPDQPTALHDRAVARQQVGDLDGARRDLDRALELDPASASAWSNRAAVRLAQGDEEGARSDVDRALELSADDGKAWFNRAVLKVRRDDFAGALQDAIRSTDADPEQAAPWELRAYARDVLGDTGAAAQDAARACELDAELPLAWFIRAKDAMRLRDARAAEAHATRALALPDPPPPTWLIRSGAREQLGDLPGAIEDLEAFLRLAPAESAEARSARQHLERLRGRR